MALQTFMQMTEPFAQNPTIDDDVSEESLEELLLSDSEANDNKKESANSNNEDDKFSKVDEDILLRDDDEEIQETQKTEDKVEEAITNNKENLEKNKENLEKVDKELEKNEENAENEDKNEENEEKNEEIAEKNEENKEKNNETRPEKEEMKVDSVSTEKESDENKENAPNEEDLLQVMEVQSDEDNSSENKENGNSNEDADNSKTIDKDEESCEKTITEDVEMDIEENNEVNEIDIDSNNLLDDNSNKAESEEKEEKEAEKADDLKETEKPSVSGKRANSTEETCAKKRKLNDLSEETTSEENVEEKTQEESTPDSSVKLFPIKQLNALNDYMLNKNLPSLSRIELEEFCLQKIVELLSSHSENSKLKHKLKLQEMLLEQTRKELQQAAKQVRETKIVQNRLLNDLATKRIDKDFIIPIKITRSVGLQAVIEKKVTKPTPPTLQVVTNVNGVVNPKPTNTNKAIKQTNPSVSRLQQSTKPKELNNVKTVVAKVQSPILVNTLNNNNNKKKTDIVDLTEDDNDKAPTKPVNKLVTPVTTGTRIMLMPYVTTNIKSPMVLKLNTVPGGNNIITTTAQNKQIPLIPQTAKTTPSPRNSVPPLRSLPSSTPNSVLKGKHPAPLPPPPPNQNQRSSKPIPPKPLLNLSKSGCGTGIVLQWKMPSDLHIYEPIASYQLFAYQETNSNPKTDNWGKIGDVKALALPMAVTLTQFTVGNRYYFAVRAVDVLERVGSFSEACQILL